jgi:hypothetical protein
MSRLDIASGDERRWSCRTFSLRKDVMNTVTYGGARVPRTAVSQRAKVKKRKRFFARFMDALTESRRQQARRMIEDHAYLLPNDPDSLA